MLRVKVRAREGGPAMSVYVGIDVHRKRSQVAVVTGDGQVQLNRNVMNGQETILKLIGGLPAGTPQQRRDVGGRAAGAPADPTRTPADRSGLRRSGHRSAARRR